MNCPYFLFTDIPLPPFLRGNLEHPPTPFDKGEFWTKMVQVHKRSAGMFIPQTNLRYYLWCLLYDRAG